MALLRAPSWQRCLQRGSGAALQRLQFSSSATRTATDKPFEDIQDPSKTRQAYSSEEGRQVPTEADEGVEREVKWGKNIPASTEQAKEELKYAGKGLAESVEMGVNVLLSKGKDAAATAARAVGMDPGRPQMSDGSMGAAGKMEHAPEWSQSGGPAASAEHARAKYDEMAATEKPNFPEGERSVTQMFPDMHSAAKLQSNTPEQQSADNEAIRRELRGAGGGGGVAGTAEPGSGAVGTSGDILQENLHNQGP